MDALCAALPAGALVADLGCGPALHGELLAQRGLTVIGVDMSLGMLARAQRRLPGQLVCGDLRALPIRSASVDGVWSSYALLHLDAAGLEAAFAEMARVLRPRGTAAVLLASVGDGKQEVPYATDRTRWFFARDLDAATGAACSAGLTVVEADVVPDAPRRPVRLLLRRR